MYKEILNSSAFSYAKTEDDFNEIKAAMRVFEYNSQGVLEFQNSRQTLAAFVSYAESVASSRVVEKLVAEFGGIEIRPGATTAFRVFECALGIVQVFSDGIVRLVTKTKTIAAAVFLVDWEMQL